MRVLYSFPTRIGTPGIGMTAWHHIAGLVEHGAAVTVICGTSEKPLPPGARLIETLRPANVRIPYRLLGLDRMTGLHDLLVARVLKASAREYDIVHTWPLGAERTLSVARSVKVPGVIERPNAHTRFAYEAVERVCRDLGIPVDRSSPHAIRPKRLDREEREYALADALLCPSDFVAQTFREAGVPAERIVRHRYGYDPVRFNAIGRTTDRPFTVGFFGRGEPRKGLHTALRAWIDAGCAATGRFVIAGTVEPAYRALLGELISHPNVEDHGYAPDPAALMRGCDVLVLPTVEEGSALVTYEGRACGCVLAVSDHSGAVCAHAVDGLVHRAGDVDELAAHLRALETDPTLLARLRAANLAGVPELTWSCAGRVLLSVYEDVSARQSRRRSVTVSQP